MSSLHSHHINQLLHILRRANVHYAQVAARIRASIHPTYHARRRAEGLGLGVDIEAAIMCEQRYVSVIPLPFLDLNASPIITTAPVIPVICVSPPTSENCPLLNCTISPPMGHKAGVPEDIASGLDNSISGFTSSSLPAIVAPHARYATACTSLSQWFASPEADALCKLPLATTLLSPLELDVPQSVSYEADNIEFPSAQEVQIKQTWSLHNIPIDVGIWSPDELREMNISPVGSDSDWSSASSSDRSASPETPVRNCIKYKR